MADRITAVTSRVSYIGGEEKIVPDLTSLLQSLAEASADGKAIQAIELLGKGMDGSEYRAILESVGMFKEQAPIGYQALLLERALGEILVSAGVATPEQVKQALDEQRKSAVKERLGEVIVRLGIATPEEVRNALLRQLGAGGS